MLKKQLYTFFWIVCIGLLQQNIAHASDQKIILDQINTYRVRHDLAPLKINAIISEEATQHSIAMAENKTPFSHDGFHQRAHRLFNQFTSPRGIAENVAYNYTTAENIVQQWLASPMHLKNIVGNYNLTGIGVARDHEGRLYVTQIFLLTLTK